MNLQDRVKGLIYGACIGDAVGLATEFMTKVEAQASYPHVKADNSDDSDDHKHNLEFKDFSNDFHRSKWKAGDWTDDSDQMILLLRMLINNKIDGKPLVNATQFAASLREWQNKGYPELGDKSGHGMGYTVARVLDHELFLVCPADAARDIWIKKGCFLAANGALMRTSILAVPYFDKNTTDKMDLARETADIAQVTHADPRCAASCVAITHALACMLRQEHTDETTGEFNFNDITQSSLEAASEYLISLKDAIGEVSTARDWSCPMCTCDNPPSANVCSVCMHRPTADEKKGSGHAGFGVKWSSQELKDRAYDAEKSKNEMKKYMCDAKSLEEMKLDEDGVIGYTYKSLGAGFYALRFGTDFRKCITQIVLEAGDADSNATVAGAILGCKLGYSKLPISWLDGLVNKEWLDGQVEALMSMFGI